MNATGVQYFVFMRDSIFEYSLVSTKHLTRYKYFLQKLFLPTGNTQNV